MMIHFPFAALPSLSPQVRAEIEAAALAANDRYLYEFVEGEAFCPYAREGRRRQETKRFVHWASELDAESLLELMAEVARDESIVVAQVIFPCIAVTPTAWMEFCTAVTNAAHKKMGGRDVLALAALHPDMSYREDTPFSLIPLFRRSPDPTIQWVRLSSLQALYKGREKGSTFIDPEQMMALIAEGPAPKPLYDRVAEANEASLRRLGVSRVVRLLDSMREEATQRYEEILAKIPAHP